MAIDATIIDQAIAWHLRQTTMDDGAWATFVAWLESDAAHARAYDRIAMTDALLPAMPAPVLAAPGLAANDDEPRYRRWPWAVGGSAVAAAAALLLMPLAMPKAAEPYQVETAPGQTRTIALQDGTRIDLSGGTRLTLDRRDPRVANLDRGEAMFTVRHDAAAPFVLRSGDLAVQDLGTVFNVSRNAARLDVQVAEGSVMFQPGADAVVLKPGQALTAQEDRHRVTVGAMAPDAIGGWRTGRIAFTGETLGDVFARVHRLYGTNVSLADGLSSRPFTGMVDLTGSAARDIPHMAALIGVEWRRDGDDWILAPQGAPRR